MIGGTSMLRAPLCRHSEAACSRVYLAPKMAALLIGQVWRGVVAWEEPLADGRRR
jgi:hypothetical protein